MEKIHIGPTVKKGNSFYDIHGNLLDGNSLMVYLGRKELVVTVPDDEVKEWIRQHLKNADSFFPSLKYLQTFLDKHKFEYVIADTKSALKV